MATAMTKPKISVVTITYNDADGLRATAESLRQQRYPFEWVVVDGGSKDPRVAQLLADDLITTSISERDNGIYDAMNKGLRLASGDFVLFLNSGDTLLDGGSLNSMAEQMGTEDVRYFGAVFCVRGRDKYIRKPKNPSIYIYHSVPGNQQATLYRRLSILPLNLDMGYKVCGDYALAATIHAQGLEAAISAEIVSRFELGGTSTFAFSKLCSEAWHIQKSVLHANICIRFISLCLRVMNMSRTYLTYRFANRAIENI